MESKTMEPAYGTKFLLLLISLYALASCAAGDFPNVPQCYESANTRCIFVYPQNGSNYCDCASKGANIIYCSSLDSVFNVSCQTNQTIYILSNGNHTLTSPVATFTNLSNITFIGLGVESTAISCVQDAENKTVGLSFEGSTNISFLNLSILGCSALRISSSSYHQNGSLKFANIFVALYFYSCENIVMYNISISLSPNATGVVVYNTVGTNIFTNSVFSNNHVSGGAAGGGGFYVEFTFCIPGDENCSDDAVSYTDRNHDSVYTFEGCTFIDNTASTSTTEDTTYLVPYRSSHFALGRGGGLSFFLKADAHRNNICITDCRFENNSATWGGGLFVEFHDDTLDNVIDVDGCFMINNHCPFTPTTGTGGGGMRLGHYVFNGNSSNYMYVPNLISLTSCSFSSNTAFNGGGLSISPTVQNVTKDQVATVFISQSNFTGNVARLGAALHVSRFAMILDGNIINVVISDCNFDSNAVNFIKYLREYGGNKTDAYQPGLGAVYINQVPVAFQTRVCFTSNSGSAIAAVGASLDFSDCFATFKDNLGMNGGAIALLGLAWLRINDNTSMKFWGNVATVDGGAIYNKYVERENLITYVNCFIRHAKYYSVKPSDWKATFEFGYNYDLNKGRLSAIYSTSILPCSWAGGSEMQLGDVFCWRGFWTYVPDFDCSAHIHSDIGKVEFTNYTIQTFPGHQIHLPVSILDDLGKDLTSNQSVFSRTLRVNGHTKNKTDYIWNLETNIEGSENSSVKVLLDSIGDRVWHITFEVNLEECPPGFQFNEGVGKCECLDNKYSGAVTCDEEAQRAYLKSIIITG